MEEFITSAGALSLVKAIVDFIKYVLANDKNGYVTQAVVWVAGVGTVLLIKVSDFAANFAVGEVTLADANAGTIALAGFGLGSAAMLANDVKKALDNNDNATKPDLVTDPPAS